MIARMCECYVCPMYVEQQRMGERESHKPERVSERRRGREKRQERRDKVQGTKLDQPNQERRAENAGEQRVYLQTAHFARVLGF